MAFIQMYAAQAAKRGAGESGFYLGLAGGGAYNAGSSFKVLRAEGGEKKLVFNQGELESRVSLIRQVIRS